VVAYVLVCYFRFPSARQFVCDGEDNIPIDLRRIENAFAICKLAIAVAKIDETESFPVKAANVCDRLGNLLSVRTHILNWRSTHESGDSAEAFNARKIVRYAEFDKAIPLAGALQLPFPFPPTLRRNLMTNPSNPESEREYCSRRRGRKLPGSLCRELKCLDDLIA
jgi:hypothetical protein